MFKLFKNIFTLTFALISILLTPAVAVDGNLTIIHTNDTHSHLLGSSPNSEYSPDGLNNDNTVGGIARLASKIKEIRAIKAREFEPVMLLDAGDFMMGTLYHFLATTLSPDLTLMHMLEYDATTIGNHELDLGPNGLAKVIGIAVANGGGATVPIVASNIQFSDVDSGDDDLKSLYDEGAIQPFLIKVLSNGLRVGVFGLLGEGAEEVSVRKNPLTFNHSTKFIQGIVDALRSKGVNLTVCLSHSGLTEDKKLAKAIKGIDVIIAGHCHAALFEPIRIENTIIVEAGSGREFLGELELSLTNGMVSIKNYRLIHMDDNIPGDTVIQGVVNQYTDAVNTNVLNPIGLDFDTPIVETKFDLIEENLSGESNIGNLVTDATRAIIDLYQPEDRVDFAFEPSGFIGNIFKGNTGVLASSDVFRALSVGMVSLDGKPGYPLVSFYINGKEVKRVLETSVLLSWAKGSEYLLQVSGLRFWYNPIRRPVFLNDPVRWLKFYCDFIRRNSNNVIRIEKWDAAQSKYAVFNASDTSNLYKIGTNLQTAAVIPLVAKQMPQLAMIPKDRSGNPIDVSTDEGKAEILVDADLDVLGIQELKHWHALTQYLSGLPDLDGNSVSDIPTIYAKPQGRINRPPDNLIQYQQVKKSPWVAVTAACLFPSLGHAYANNWWYRGTKFLLLNLGSAILMSRKRTVALGYLSLLGFKLWEFWDAYHAIEDHNRKLAKKYHVEF